MTIQRTSIEVYHQIKTEGLLSRLRFEVYDILYRFGPLTQGECWKFYMPSKNRPSVTPRFAELEARGVIESTGSRPCKVTGRESMIWVTTNRIPENPPKITKIKCSYCDGKGYVEQGRFAL